MKVIFETCICAEITCQIPYAHILGTIVLMSIVCLRDSMRYLIPARLLDGPGWICISCMHCKRCFLKGRFKEKFPLEQVSEARCLASLSYHEAWEMSYFGASVLHPRTTMPAMKYSIPITIRNFFNLESPGESSKMPSEVPSILPISPYTTYICGIYTDRNFG